MNPAPTALRASRRTPAQTAARRATSALALVVMLGLAACAPAAPEPQLTSTATAAPQPTAAPEPEPSPGEPNGEAAEGAVSIPACGELITDAEAVELCAPNFEADQKPSAVSQEELRRSRLGPVAIVAYEQVEQFRPCYWGVPLSGVIEHVFVAELPTDVREEFVAELRNSDYAESAAHGIALFSRTFGDPLETTWYGFIGDMWIASFGQQGSAPIELVAGKLRAANPE